MMYAPQVMMLIMEFARVKLIMFSGSSFCPVRASTERILNIVSDAGMRYVTGSDSFWSSFIDIWDDMKEGEDPEDFSIRVYKRPSKNYSGKSFLTCSLVLD